ncbi:MAG TPA: ABC transporter ATP-binding protein, partial [Clostridiales bacterium]|nr:ABC transporter ATP-binding protein [Clostridiales bacterium]
IRNNTFATVGNSAVITLRGKLYERIQDMSLAGISEKTAGELINRVTQDTREISSFLSKTLPTLVEQLLILFSVGTVMFLYDWRLALMILLPLPVVI